MPSEVLLDTRHDRSRRADGKLLSRDLEDQGSEGVERRQLVHPCPRTEIRTGVDQPRHDRVGGPKKLPRLGVGEGRATDFPLVFLHRRHSGSFLKQAFRKHNLHHFRNGLLAGPVALKLAGGSASSSSASSGSVGAWRPEATWIVEWTTGTEYSFASFTVEMAFLSRRS